MSERVLRLKEEFFAAPPQWCLERARLYTEAYRKYQCEAAIVRRAEALAHLLDNKTIFIRDGELIAGNYSQGLATYELYPEYSCQDLVWRYTHFEFKGDVDESYFENESDKRLLGEIREFWRGKSMSEISETVIPAHIRKARDSREICGNPYGRDEGQGHISVDYEKAVQEGFRYIIDQAKARMAEVEANDPKAYDFLRAVIITSEATIRFAHRLADEAGRLAQAETDPTRAAELETMAANLRHVPEHPAETFRQACQTVWLVHLIMHLEQNGFSISLGRLDQYMLPLYERDIEAGHLTRAQAQELIESLYMKCMEITIGGVKISLTQTVTICGSDPAGNDLTNDLSFLCIAADRETRMVQPSTIVRWHKNIDQRVMTEVMEATHAGDASIAIISDDAHVPGLIDAGIPAEDAYQYTQVGCNETAIGGKLIGGGIARPITLIRVIELIMNGGVFPYTGEPMGPTTKKLGEYDSFDEFMEAYRSHMNFWGKYVAQAINIMDNLHATHTPLPFASSLMNGTIERGRDIMEATDYFFPVMGQVDFIAGLNCLAAIKKCVFDDKSVTQEELRDALAANFAGYEEVHKKLLDAPKFGNDDDYVDGMVPMLEGITRDCMRPYRSFRNNSEWRFFECIPRISHVFEGLASGATPEGRLAGESMPAGISAQPGTDVNGATALLNSLAKMDTKFWCGGIIQNIRFHENLMKDEASRDKIRQLVNVYFEKGGSHLQMNCVRKETLLDAQKNPKNYRDLMVRVSGYVDYFTNLDEASQADIIRRIEHAR